MPIKTPRILIPSFWALFFTLGLLAGPSQADPLPKLNIDKTSVTISGVSSGGFMAVQTQIALSSLINGVASVAGGIYHCSEGSVWKAQRECMEHPEKINVESKIKKAREEAADGNIDPLENLSRSRIYIFSSPIDDRVRFGNVQKLLDFYQPFTPPSQIFVRSDILAAHSWITNSFGNECSAHAPPWISNCNFDLSGEILSYLYGPLRPAAQEESLRYAQYQRFDQGEFNELTTGLDKTGFLFVPTQCQGGQTPCKLHVALHGCGMNSHLIDDKFVVHSGLNSWAEANNIVILYPQIKVDPLFNPKACWDWWGHTSVNYANKKGPQIRALEKMILRLIGKY